MTFDPNRRFVRVLGEREGFVEFEFAMGEPELMAELVMPRAAFETFCRVQQVEFLAPEAGDGAPAEDARDTGNWHLRDATRERIS